MGKEKSKSAMDERSGLGVREDPIAEDGSFTPVFEGKEVDGADSRLSGGVPRELDSEDEKGDAKKGGRKNARKK